MMMNDMNALVAEPTTCEKVVIGIGTGAVFAGGAVGVAALVVRYAPELGIAGPIGILFFGGAVSATVGSIAGLQAREIKQTFANLIGWCRDKCTKSDRDAGSSYRGMLRV